MALNQKALFIYQARLPEAQEFAFSLAAGLPDMQIKVTHVGLTTFLFEIKKFKLIHFFLPANIKLPGWIARKSPQAAVFQTILSEPAEPSLYKEIVFADHVVVFSQKEKNEILQQVPQTKVDVVLPYARIPSIDQLKPPSTVRQAYDVQDRLLVVALSDFSDQKHFTVFLYTAREYQRRGGFRFLIPVYRKDKETIRWRDRLKQIVEQEKLTSTTLLQEGEDIHSLIDSADFTIFADRNPRGFGFPLLVSEALHAGKPVLCFQPGPVSEFVSGFNRNWVCHENEDFSRISKDLAKQGPHLEQISTELARFSRTHLSAEAVLAKYRQLYNSAGSR